MPDAPDPITSPPAVAGQPWDASSDATVAGWTSVDSGSGPASMTDGHATGEFEDGPGPWKQT
jgi:hypothetical protein